MTEAVVDASTVLAYILDELVASSDDVIDRAVLSAVNLAEVRTKLIDVGRLYKNSTAEALLRLLRVVPFTEQQALTAAALRPATRHLGLSLGDRARLALALTLQVDVYTADRTWAKLDVGCKVHLIR